MKITTLYKIYLKTLIIKKVKFLPVIISSVEKQGLTKDFILLNLSLLKAVTSKFVVVFKV